MRTRFLTTDYFNTNQSLTFLRLPLPHLQLPHPPNHLSSLSSNLSDELLRCIDSSSCASISLQIDSFPIENALSKLFSDVLPHTIDAGDCIPSASRWFRRTEFLQIPEKESNIAYEESATKTSGTSNSETYLSALAEHERRDDSTNGKHKNVSVLLQLEIPELTQDLENAFIYEEEKIHLSEVQECDDNMEMLNTGLADPYHCDINELVDTAKTVCLDYDMEQKPQMPEEFSLLWGNVRSFNCILPLFEVDEMGMEDPGSVCIENELHCFFEDIEVENFASNDDLELNCLLGSSEMGILELIDDHHTSKLHLDLQSLNSALDIDILQVVETPMGIRDVSLFEELEMLDAESFEIFQPHTICQIAKEPEMCHELFHGDMNFKSFDDLIVSRELTIIDESFISLPVPALKDDKETCSLRVIITGIFPRVEPVPLSATDEIYLDWNLLGEDKCSNNVVTAIEKVFSDAQESTVGLSLSPNEGSMLMLDLLLLDDPLNCRNVSENKLDLPGGGCFPVKQRMNTVASSSWSDDDCQIIENTENIANAKSEKAVLHVLLDDDCQIIEDTMLTDRDFRKLAPSTVSMPHFNDLDFFLNPRKATGNMKVDDRLRAQDENSLFSNGFHKRKVAPPIQMQELHVQLHTLSLPANFSILIANLQSSYLAVFDDGRKLNRIELSTTNSDDLNLLGLSEENLLEHMTKPTKQQSCVGHGYDNAIYTITLCAIKRMAWCLCFWGIDTLHLFVCELFQRLGCLKSRLYFLHSLIEDAYVEVDKEITKSHPSLAIIKEILQLNPTKGKVLILAQQILWGPLKRLLSSMDTAFTAVEDTSMLENHPNFFGDFFNAEAAGPNDHLKGACLLLSHEDISPSILLQKFDIVLEYGGPSGISKVATLSPEYIGAQRLHFLKVELDDPTKALCEGVNVASDNRSRIEFGDLLNFGSMMENLMLGSSEAAGRTSPWSRHVPGCSRPEEPKANQPNDSSFPNAIIVVNTQNSDKGMIISRRSSYQKILTLERRGGLVVERDLILPVDIVVDAATCIVWYDSKNIASKTIAQDEGSSSIPICIENIATNVLTSLSFAFTACILIFEGEGNFLDSVMESADELYAAAAGLGIHLQIFCSYSSDLTDEIILGSVGQTKKLSQGALPTLPESETIAESFLAKFPSINPLSAHCIISSGCTLLEFLELSAKRRIQVLRNYHVPDESINFFSILCKYGELEGSKSGLTDCSSSISSPPDSEIVAHKINSEDRKRKFVPSSSDIMYESRCSMPSSKHTEDRVISQNTRRPLDSELPKGPSISLKRKLFTEEVFSEGGVLDTTSNKDPSNPWWRSNDTGEPKDPQMEDGFAQSPLLLNDRFLDQQKIGMTTKTTHEYDGNILQGVHKDLIDDTNIFSKPMLGEDFQVTEHVVTSSPFSSKAVTNHAPKHKSTSRRLSFGRSFYPTFPSAEEINLSFGPEDDSQLRVDDDCMSAEYNWSKGDIKPQKGPTRGSFMENSTQKSGMPVSKEKDFFSFGETPLSKAIHSDNLQKGSPWTMDFLNRIKEKRRLLQQRQPYSASAPSSSHRGDVNRITKRRSPSILEYYKYQGGSTPSKVTRQQKRQKQDDQQVNEKPSGFVPTWTPTDKRARRTLSFATGGTRGQAKLVWRDNVSSSQRSRFSDGM